MGGWVEKICGIMGDYPAFLSYLLDTETADLWPEERELAELADRITKRLGGRIRELHTRVANRASEIAGETRGKAAKYLEGSDPEMAREILEGANQISEQMADEIVRVQALLPSPAEGRQAGGKERYQEFLSASVSHLIDMANSVAGRCSRMEKHGESRQGEALDALKEVSEILSDIRRAEKASGEVWS